ncbi:hypothetical protein ACODT3_38365 [Streptomyces sp. 4.24]|uniref:hypothetical protein n=1 Tax=Streptomyces tritrimontium TaxID=3406573 RepID=UPI003BB59268
MLAVLAMESDALAAAVMRMAAARGVAAVRLAGFEQVAFSMHVDTTGEARVSLVHTGTDARVTSVVNRYPFLSPPGTGREAAFVQAENTAGWWAVLGSFPGPVVNRPDGRGLLPGTDRVMTAGVPVRRPVQIFHADFRPARTGVLSSSGGRTVQRADEDVVVTESAGFQALNLPCLRQYVLAGRRLLRSDGTRPDPSESARVLDLFETELPALGIAVVEVEGVEGESASARTTLVDYDPLPPLDRLAAAGPAAVSALFEDCLT